ncbi:MAG: baseplate J/gp47 family protein [Candidatus Kerfeldbacteria bacterium]|nr:baseplate J/gp47 family protein [Candidatus Kerfeldbacteria bacterium]
MPATQRLQRYFSPILVVFVCVVVLLVLAVVYVAFSKTTVAITLKAIPARIPFQYSADDVGVEPVVVPINHSFTFTDYEASTSTDAIARGTVTLVNDYSVAQPLVRTTRLLSKSGVLFHTDDTVTVPAGGSIDVAVYADQPGSSGNIAADTFEIVALSSSLKEQIYATSTDPMTGGVIKKVQLTDEIIAEAKVAAQTAAEETAQQTVVETLEQSSAFDANNLVITITDQMVNGSVGEEVEVVTVQSTGVATYVSLTDTLLHDALVADDQPITTDATITYTIATDGSELVVSGEASGAQLEPSLDFVDAAALTGKTEQQVQDYLADFEQVEAVTVQFVPFWSDRTPQLPQQINLILAQ